MNKMIALFLALALLLSLTACGGGADKPSGGAAEPDNGGAAQKTEQSASPQSASPEPASPEPVQPDGGESDAADRAKVEVKGDTVIFTESDGAGNTSVMEYVYDGDVLSKIVLTMECGDSDAAKYLYEQMMSGDAKAMTEETYSSVELGEKTVVCTMNDEMVAVFASFSKEDLASLLAS